MYLCERGPAGFNLTEEGRMIYQSTLQLFADLEQFQQRANSLRSRMRGTLRLGLTDDTATNSGYRISDFIERFGNHAPDVRIDLYVGSPNEIERAVIRNRVHIGIVPVHRRIKNLRYYDLYTEKLMLCCGRRHELFPKNDQEIEVSDLYNYKFSTPTYYHRIKIKKLLPNIIKGSQSNQIEGIAILIISGGYLGFLPDHFARQWIVAGRMREIRPEELFYNVTFAAIDRRDAPPNILKETILPFLIGQDTNSC